eukprot:Blabericola_migrator_1__13201@NODE_90_length_14571_cov_105_361280_g80_i0_p2_GENE_NODE_90_length_14571_cov_105_361280_g80_i0NODE_90_length_14571_cov_105_361280_g80_i0_p2_ORF_typecomplete_len904_score66_74Sulfate_transp/PF00916_20/7e96STAS/PF01740_21/2e14STAS_2/PF13466_6/0_31_NODE_90_length_14571_cov_105_361280_g80_i034036114
MRLKSTAESMPTFVTEKDLNRDFFDTKPDVQDVSGQDGDELDPCCVKLCRGPLQICRSIGENVLFCWRVLPPLIVVKLALKWERFSFFDLLKGSVPGVTLLIVSFKALWIAIRGCRNSSQQKETGTDVSQVDTPDAVSAGPEPFSRIAPVTPSQSQAPVPINEPRNTATDDASFSSAYPTVALVKGNFLQDLFVGFSVGAMSVPQGMSYALLAGLDYQYGLYNGFMHPAMYFLFGTCRHAVLGVSAIENLMLGERLTSMLGEDATSSQRINAAISLSFMSAVVFTLFRICRLAVIADLLADSVLSGFATASAFVIGVSQLKHAFGMTAVKNDWGVPKTVIYVVSHLSIARWAAVMCCFISLVFLILCKKVSNRYCRKFPIPAPLILVIVSCLISWSVNLKETYGISIVGNIPRGLPSAYVPSIHWGRNTTDHNAPSVRELFVQCLSLCPIYFIIHISIAKTIATRQKYFLRYGQELTAFAAANIVGGFFQCYPACTSVSRSSVAESLGAKTHYHGLAAAIVVICTLVFLTGPLGYLPMPCLAAVVLFGVAKMAEFEVLGRLWRLQKTSWAASGQVGGGAHSPDLFLWLLAFLCTIVFGASEGVIISVILSLVWVGRGIVRPEFTQLGRLPNTTIYRNTARFPEAETFPGIVIYRIDAPLNFCNAGFLERTTRQIILEEFPTQQEVEEGLKQQNRVCLGPAWKASKHHASPATEQIAAPNGPPYFFILDCSSVNALDVTAISALARIASFAATREVFLIFANWKGPQRDFLYKADFYRVVPPNHCFLSIHDAVQWSFAVQAISRVDPSPFVSTCVGSTELRDTWEGEEEEEMFPRPRQGHEPAQLVVTTDPQSFGLPSSQPQLEWDCLSAFVPNVRAVQEVGQDGPRTWMVTTQLPEAPHPSFL